MLNIKDILGAEALAEKELPEHHPDCNTIAALAEGRLAGEEQEEAAEHISRCPECSRIFMTTSKELEREELKNPAAFWQNRNFLALAASLVICIAGGTGLWQSGMLTPNMPVSSSHQVLITSVAMDGELEAALKQGTSGLGYEARENLSRLLIDRGVQLAAVERIEIDRFSFVQQKSLFRKAEELQIRLENGVLYLKVVESKKNIDNGGDDDSGDIELFFSPPPEK